MEVTGRFEGYIKKNLNKKKELFIYSTNEASTTTTIGAVDIAGGCCIAVLQTIGNETDMAAMVLAAAARTVVVRRLM